MATSGELSIEALTKLERSAQGFWFEEAGILTRSPTLSKSLPILVNGEASDHSPVISVIAGGNSAISHQVDEINRQGNELKKPLASPAGGRKWMAVLAGY